MNQSRNWESSKMKNVNPTIVAVFGLFALSPAFIVACDVAKDVIEYKLKPLQLGVEVIGVDLQKHAHDASLFERIKNDVYRHRMLVFRKQGVIPAEPLLAISEHFGSLFTEPFTTQKNFASKHAKSPAPAIMRISNDVAEGVKGLGTTGWHHDGAYKEKPFSFLIWNAVSIPREGDTKFVGFREVLSSMNEKVIEKWEKLSTIITRTVLGKKVFEIHPLIYNHNVINETVICLHTGYMEGAIEHYGFSNQRYLTDNETEVLRAEMNQEFSKDNERLVYSHKWQLGDLVIVDNLQTAHLASKESQMPVEEVGLRVLHRVAVNGVQKPSKLPFINKHWSK